MFVNAISEKDKRLIAEGEARGKLEALKNTARQMKLDNISPANIAKYTGLSNEEIEAL